MKQQLTLGSLFDGIGGWQLAAVRAGVKPVWSSEIEAFPLEVTKRHFHDTIQLGDVTKLGGVFVWRKPWIVRNRADERRQDRQAEREGRRFSG